ncbi:MAG TPA: NAD-dependent epimerase/dehydratase family protein [Acetobacteraceae bacterium]|nr:NAD-dependent epimerase/dehydratase family protein [Acetobacteraceae bacterium]
MRVLVTGGTGFLGRHLVPWLRGAGHEVLAPGRDALHAESPIEAWRAALPGVEAVLHLAGRAHRVGEVTGAAAAAFMATNRDWPIRLARAAREAGVARFLFVSTIGVHGPGGTVTEASPLLPATPYARSKLEAEEGLPEAFGGPVTILRPPLVCGPGAPGNLARLRRLAATPLPLPLGAVRNRRTLLSVEGFCTAVEAVLRRWAAGGEAAGAYVLGDAAPLSTRDMLVALREGLGRPPRLLPVPPALLAAALRAAGRGAIAAQLLGDLVVDSAAFRREFGWQPVADTRATLRAMARAG